MNYSVLFSSGIVLVDMVFSFLCMPWLVPLIFMLFPDKTNKESVRAIQKSIFTVCLDAPVPRVSDEMYPNKVAAQMLHGGGSRWNSGNRWFDKTLQVHYMISKSSVHR